MANLVKHPCKIALGTFHGDIVVSGHHTELLWSVESAQTDERQSDAQIRVYPLSSVRAGEDEDGGGPVCAAFIHRLPSKMSSIAWCPFDEVCPSFPPPSS